MCCEQAMARILIFEDNEMNRDVLQRRLVRHGFEVAVAVDGPTGLAMAAAQVPDLVLMDLGLPGMDGLEATRSLKRNPATAQIPVIALTAHAMESDRHAAFAAGCVAFDSKPIDLARLLAIIQSVLAARSP